jgi:hypothetical protein
VSVEEAFTEYVSFLENLTLDNVDELSNFVHVNVVFSDPFHNVVGVKMMIKILKRMFASVSQIQFIVLRYAINNNVVYFNWKLVGLLSKKKLNIEGVTCLKYGVGYEILEHLEYWDAASQLYERFPIIGPVLKYFRRQISR